jgi:hypothetical protein
MIASIRTLIAVRFPNAKKCSCMCYKMLGILDQHEKRDPPDADARFKASREKAEDKKFGYGDWS